MSAKVATKHKENAIIKVLAHRISEEKATRAFGPSNYNKMYIHKHVVRSELFKKDGNANMSTRVFCRLVSSMHAM
jgi:hypothetical protein